MRGDSHVTPFIWMGLFLIEGVVVVWPGRGVRLGASGRGSCPSPLAVWVPVGAADGTRYLPSDSVVVQVPAGIAGRCWWPALCACLRTRLLVWTGFGAA